MSSICSRIIKSILLHENLEALLTSEQQEWMADETKCSACGTLLHTYNHTCPECGLFIKNQVHFSPYSFSEPIEKINYIYKDDEEN